jgi:hypothetical protein
MKTTVFALALFFFSLPGLGAQTLVGWWDHSGKDVQGNPSTLVSVEYGLAKDGAVSPNTSATSIEARTTVKLEGDWKAAIGPKIAHLPAATQASILAAYRADDLAFLMAGLTGSTYRVWARVSDSNGRWSRWTASVGTFLMNPAQPAKVEVK